MTSHEAAVIAAAQTGDQWAQDELVATYLPLVYNIVGRALQGHADVDDVVQETMLRVLHNLGSLQRPDGFRSWLVAVTMNEIRRHWRGGQPVPTGAGMDEAADIADPGADFVDLTIIRLGLSGQRREVAEATRWLDEDDRALLSLWWLEAAGELTRAEVAAAMEQSVQHTAVRVQRMKTQLETARVVVRALSTQPLCEELRGMLGHWDGVPSALWRKRVARHARGCVACSGHWSGLVPAEGLLVGLGLVPATSGLAWLISNGFQGETVASAAELGDPGQAFDQVADMAPRPASPVSHRAGGRRPGAHRAHRALRGRPRGAVAVAGGAAVTATAAAAALSIALASPGGSKSNTSAPAAPLAKTSTAATSPDATPTPTASRPSHSPSADPTATPSRTKSVVVSRETRATATPSRPRPSTPTARPRTSNDPAQQVLALINKARAEHGLPAYTMGSGLVRSAAAHNSAMDDGCGLSHQCAGEAALGERETAHGVQWGAAGENIGQASSGSATQQIADAALGLTQSMLDEKPPNDGHRQNILSTTFHHVGISVHRNAQGTVWLTQDFSD
ncbi:sigma-70 family RNA polymerase sigma factor [Streptomyces sp. NPDC002004]